MHVQKLSECVTVRDVVRWILHHPLWDFPGNLSFGGYHSMITYDLVYVNPQTETIEDDDSLNTAFRVWIEAGGWEKDSPGYEGNPIYKGYSKCWDPDLDCGGASMEEALLELARLVDLHYDERGKKR